MFEKIKNIFTEYVPENLTEAELSERLKKSMSYDDGTLMKYHKSDSMDDKALLFIKPDGTAILIDGKTGKIPKAWQTYDIDSKQIEAYKEKFRMTKEEPVKTGVPIEKEETSKPKININKEEPILN